MVEAIGSSVRAVERRGLQVAFRGRVLGSKKPASTVRRAPTTNLVNPNLLKMKKHSLTGSVLEVIACFSESKKM